jgi:hypothetical protein
MKTDIDSLSSMNKNSTKNTWYNYNNSIPNITKTDSYLLVKTDSAEVYIDRFQEIILLIINNFLFAPVWLVRKWFESKTLISDLSPDDIMISWIKTGLIWQEISITGTYLRPTYLLFKLFNRKIENFTEIPFNQLTHTISEEEVCFNVMVGEKTFYLNQKLNSIYIPSYSPLGLKTTLETKLSTNILNEANFRSVQLYLKNNIDMINNTEHKIQEEIEKGQNITSEFHDFTKFIIVKKINNKGNIKDYEFHIPDLIIPIPRLKGKAQSIAIEVELSNKGLSRYIHTLNKYKDNNRFGYVVWLVKNGSIAQNLRIAYQKTNGLGQTKMLINEFEIPYPKPNLTF